MVTTFTPSWSPSTNNLSISFIYSPFGRARNFLIRYFLFECCFFALRKEMFIGLNRFVLIHSFRFTHSNVCPYSFNIVDDVCGADVARQGLYEHYLNPEPTTQHQDQSTQTLMWAKRWISYRTFTKQKKHKQKQ